MTDRQIAASEAPFHAQSNGVNLGQLEQEIADETQMRPSKIVSDGSVITITFTQTDPPDVSTLLPIVQSHDGRPKGMTTRRRSDGTQVVTMAPPTYDAAPSHRSKTVVCSAGGTSFAEHHIGSDCRIMGGRFWVGANAAFGDKITVQIVDKDGVLPSPLGGTLPPGTVLATPVPGLHLPPGGTGTSRFEVNSGQWIPVYGGTYILFKYESSVVSGDDVEAIVYWSELDGHEA